MFLPESLPKQGVRYYANFANNVPQGVLGNITHITCSWHFYEQAM